MKKLVRNFNLKSQRVASKTLFKYCSLEETEIDGKKVVWTLENLKNQTLYFSRFSDFDDFNELKMGFKLQNGVDFYVDEAMSGDVDKHLDSLSEDEITKLKRIFQDIDNPDDIDVNTFIQFMKTDVYKRIVEDAISQSEHLKQIPYLNHDNLMSVIERTSEIYLEDGKRKSDMTIDFQDWSKLKLDEAADKIDISDLELEDLKTKLREFKKIINDVYVCTCLSTSYDNYNNWQLFSKGRDGLVIEYDFSKENLEFHSNYTFLKVKYSKTPVMADLVLFNRIKNNLNDKNNVVGLLEFIALVIKTKNILLKSEDEIRIVAGKERLENNHFLMDVSKYIKAVYVYRDNKSKYLKELISICKNRNIDFYWLEDTLDTYDVITNKVDWG